MFLGHIVHYADGYISPLRFLSVILNTVEGYACRSRPPTYTPLALGLGEQVFGAAAAARAWTVGRPHQDAGVFRFVSDHQRPHDGASYTEYWDATKSSSPSLKYVFATSRSSDAPREAGFETIALSSRSAIQWVLFKQRAIYSLKRTKVRKECTGKQA